MGQTLIGNIFYNQQITEKEKETMEEKILNILKNVNEDLLTFQGENMMAEGLVDSFGIIRIIGELEDAFDLEIDAADVTVENFGNKDKILTLIHELVNG